jgi:hypothetical protein
MQLEAIPDYEGNKEVAVSKDEKRKKKEDPGSISLMDMTYLNRLGHAAGYSRRSGHRRARVDGPR